MNEVGKTTDGLMDHIRDDHGIAIGGEQDRKDLLEMGYFHGYKAYRFLRTNDKPFSIESFSEIKAIYEFDNGLKTVLYPCVMRLETTIKNYTLDLIVENSPTDLDSIFNNSLTRYKEFQVDSGKYRSEVKKRLILKRNFYDTIARNYSESKIIQHYIHANEPIPIWAIFEHITLGDYGDFLLCLNTNIRLSLEKVIGVDDIVNDTSGSMLSRHIFLIKELRNAIAHNKIIFDCRFRNTGISKILIKQLEDKMELSNITFNSILDYFTLIIYYQLSLGEHLEFVEHLVNNIQILIDFLHESVNKSTFDKIVGTDAYNKIELLRVRVSN